MEEPEGIKDLSVVLDILKPLESKWLDVGIHLKIKKDTILDSIEANHSKDVHRCLTEVIAHWQTNEDEPSWEKLASAVKKVSGYSDVLKSIPGHLTSMASTGEDSDSGFGTSSSTPPSQTSSDSEQDVFDTSSLPPGCGCGECNIHKMCTEGCPKPDYSKRLPILTKYTGGETASETASKRIAAPTVIGHQRSVNIYEQGTEQLNKDFGSFFTDTCTSFKKQHEKKTVALYLRSSFPILKGKTDEIRRAEDMEDLFDILLDVCSWFNINIIESLIEKFGSLDDKKRLADYRRKFKSFAKQRLPQGMTHVELGSKAGMTGCKKLVIKVDREWESISIGGLERLCREFAKILEIERKNLYLADVNEGCIMLTLMVPKEIANTLSLRKLTSAQKQMLTSERVVRLSCGRLKWSRPSSTTQHSSSDSEELKDMEYIECELKPRMKSRPIPSGRIALFVSVSLMLLVGALAATLFLGPFAMRRHNSSDALPTSPDITILSSQYKVRLIVLQTTSHCDSVDEPLSLYFSEEVREVYTFCHEHNNIVRINTKESIALQDLVLHFEPVEARIQISGESVTQYYYHANSSPDLKTNPLIVIILSGAVIIARRHNVKHAVAQANSDSMCLQIPSMTADIKMHFENGSELTASFEVQVILNRKRIKWKTHVSFTPALCNHKKRHKASLLVLLEQQAICFVTAVITLPG